MTDRDELRTLIEELFMYVDPSDREMYRERIDTILARPVYTDDGCPGGEVHDALGAAAFHCGYEKARRELGLLGVPYIVTHDSHDGRYEWRVYAPCSADAVLRAQRRNASEGPVIAVRPDEGGSREPITGEDR